MTVPVINPRDLAEKCKNRETIEIIDVRTPMEFREVHLTIARNVPLDTLDPVAVMKARNGSKQEPIYVICRSGSRGQQACEQFVAAGFTNIVNVEGGTLACVECGLPVIRGKKGVSLQRQVSVTAGLLVLLGVLLWFVHPAFLALSAFIGVGLVYSAVTDTCPMGMLLAKMPWNRA